MELFSEIYGVYYQIVEELLQSAPLTRADIQKKVLCSGFGESVLELLPKLLDEGAWPLLREKDGLWHSRLRRKPRSPVSLLELRWLKSALTDPRARLFLSDRELDRLQKALSGIAPLYQQDWFVCFDRHLDGDPYTQEAYRFHFRAVLEALREKRPLWIAYRPAKRREEDTRIEGVFLPLSLEYSAKDDKFRLHCARVLNHTPAGGAVINLGRILKTGAREAPLLLTQKERQRLCSRPKKTVLVEVRPQRNAIERFQMEFSSYEKQSECDDETGRVRVRVCYQKEEETEVLIRILGFGPMVRVLSPEPFLALVRERVSRQAALTGKRESPDGKSHPEHAADGASPSDCFFIKTGKKLIRSITQNGEST